MGRSRWAHETMCVQPSIWTHIAVTRSVPATDYWNRLYGSGKGPIWVQPLVAKRESSFHKQLLWHSDMQCDPAFMAHSEQCQGELRIMLAWGKGNDMCVSRECYCQRGHWFGGALNLGTKEDAQFGLHGTMVLWWNSTDEITWCNGTGYLNSFKHFHQCEYNTVTLFIN